MTENLDFLNNIIKKALSLGASQAEAICCETKGNEVGCRFGKLEEQEGYESVALGVRVFKGQKQVSLSYSGKTLEIAEKMVSKAIDMVEFVPDDEFCSLASPAQIIGKELPNLELNDEYEPSLSELVKLSQNIEKTALSNPKVSNSEGAGVSFYKRKIAIVASNGLASTYNKSKFSVGVSVVAGEGDNKERDGEGHTTVYWQDLDDAEKIGTKASDKAVAMLGAKKIKTAEMPVIFDRQIASSLLSHFVSATLGNQIAKGATFLKDKKGKKIFNPQISIIDNPLIPRGLGSRPFDAEGLPCQKEIMVDKGILKNWFLDLSSSRKLGLESLAHASVSLGGIPYPSPSNLYINNGIASFQDVCQEYDNLFLVTSLSGQGVNIINGNYSRGAKGFIVNKRAEKLYPVSEVTISGNLLDIFAQLIPLNDLEFRYSLNSPSLLINKMMVAGE